MKTQETALSACLVREPNNFYVYCLAINHSIFVEGSDLTFLGLETVSPDHKVASGPQKGSAPNLQKTIKNNPKTGLSAPMKESAAVTFATNTSFFIK